MPISASAVGSGIAATCGTPPEQSASCIVAKTAAGSHTLTIDGYSRIKERSNDDHRKSIKSATFTVGGHSCDGEEVSAAYKFSLLDQNGQPSYSYSSNSVGDVCRFTETMSHAVPFVETKFLESRTTTYLRGDRLRVRCDVTVCKELRCKDRDVPTRLVAVPPPDMGEHLGRLLSSGVGADLTFEVAGGETFAVHRYILAVRSPVLLQEIISAAVLMMKRETEASTSCGVQVCGMEAGVFKALLHYIYTDSVLEIDEGERMDTARHLIAVADRYSLGSKLICEDMLCRCVDTSTVAATLAIAEQYNCHGLKKACVQFLMSGSNLKAAMATGGFEHLRSSCPSVLKELLAMVDRR